ncbi:MAG: helix-turn-helix domain-containing protein [Flavobacterium sp.]|jgi:transcriptional regulator with XRE-family HTH domain
MELSEIIKVIKLRREVLNVTQETLASLSGVGLRTLKQLESGKGNPTFLTLQRITDVLGMEISLKIKNTSNKQ